MVKYEKRGDTLEETRPEVTTTPNESVLNQTAAPGEVKPEKYPVSPNLYHLRRYFIYILVGGLIVSALIAIIAVLVGNMSGLIGKSIATVAIVIIHSLVALAFISATSSKQANKGSEAVVYTLFGITILSLATSMLATWEVITDESLIVRQYLVFFAAFITSTVIYGLFEATEDDKSTVISRNTAIGSSLLSFVLVLPVIYEIGTLPEMYYRVLTAISIIVGVSIVITVIFHWYYISKHPKVLDNGEVAKPMPISKMVGISVLILIGIWISMGVIVSVYSAIPSRDTQPRNQRSSLY